MLDTSVLAHRVFKKAWDRNKQTTLVCRNDTSNSITYIEILVNSMKVCKIKKNLTETVKFDRIILYFYIYL